MWILAYFTRDGEPATSLSPIVKIRDVDTGAVVVSGSSMIEKGDGFYGYEFSSYNPLNDYAIVCDSVTLSGVERYTYASSGEYNEVLDTIESTVGVVDIRTTLLRKIQTNRLELFDGDTDNWILYDDDSSTPLLTFSVSDKDGDLIVQQQHTPSKRDGATGPTVTGSLSPDIYMRKSVYDPDNDGRVSEAESVNDGNHASTASGIRRAVVNTHSPYLLGTKYIAESTIGNEQYVKYNAVLDRLEYGIPGVSGTVSGINDHGSLGGLGDDDHTQYILVDGSRGFTSTVSGVYPTSSGHLTTKQYVDEQITAISGGTLDHGLLLGLGDDDHPQYLNESRGDARYYTQTEVDALLGQNKSGRESLGNGDSSTVVNFATSFSVDNYALVVSLENNVDSPASEYAVTITSKTTSGFEVNYSGDIDSNNYYLNWYATLSGGLGGGNYIANLVDDTTPQLGGDLELGNHSVVLNTTPSGDVLHGYIVGWSGDISTMSVDLNDTGFGCPLYMKSNGHWAQCTAASGTSQMPCTAMALEEGTGSKKILWKGMIRKGVWSWTPGTIIYVSTVEGALTSAQPTSSGTWSQAVGVAISSDVIRFDPAFDIGSIN